VQNVKMSSGKKNEPEPAQKRPRPVGPFRPTESIFVSVHAALFSVLSSWNPKHRGKLPLAKNAV
jgi:hypothetical protein